MRRDFQINCFALDDFERHSRQRPGHGELVDIDGKVHHRAITDGGRSADHDGRRQGLTFLAGLVPVYGHAAGRTTEIYPRFRR
jgi:hypothetical protein